MISKDFVEGGAVVVLPNHATGAFCLWGYATQAEHGQYSVQVMKSWGLRELAKAKWPPGTSSLGLVSYEEWPDSNLIKSAVVTVGPELPMLFGEAEEIGLIFHQCNVSIQLFLSGLSSRGGMSEEHCHCACKPSLEEGPHEEAVA